MATREAQRGQVKHFLFVCSQNKLRSPTAEQIFAAYPGIETDSAGTNHDAENPLTGELIAWADSIFVMELTHRTKLQSRFRRHLRGQRIVCLDIADDYAFMDAALIDLLHKRMARHLPPAPGTISRCAD
ncbi:low molecular weight protein tyrosine phosphatase family protein [Sphingomonas sp. RB3P16]|uniref:low molecular weight protein tyrosine phosphatase family protein n=1 Tax=Parasphingomonas frigoris TaxID=3096163 RepID=UPI002FC5AC48